MCDAAPAPKRRSCEDPIVQIAIVSDTHLPRGGRRLPDSCMARMQAADLIVHAGDLIALPVLTELEAYGVVVAVHGNVDGPDVRAALPESAMIELPGARIGVVHDAGPADGRLRRMRKRFPDADAVVFGHSHIPLHDRDENGFQIFNPGSPTDRRRSPQHTMGIARVDAGKIEFELVALD
jgi:putative phosphoesterase